MNIQLYRLRFLLPVLLLLTACNGINIQPTASPAGTTPMVETAQPQVNTPLPVPTMGAPGPASGGPAGQPGGPASSGPWEDSIYVATSSDGLTWSEGVLLAERASVPEVIYTSQGVYWAYWVDFTEFNGPKTEKIGVARSADGVNWEKLGTVTFDGIGDMTPVDPDVIELPDGRLRMYFYNIAGAPGQNTIYSAVSSDGVHYEVEEGSRLTADGIFDPNVIRLPDGRYRMYLNRQDIISASSDNGLTFTLDDGVRVEKGAVPGAVVLSDGAIRLYACVKGISVYFSPDGLNFALDYESVIPIPAQGGVVCDPSVTATPSGYLMVYKYHPALASAATPPPVSSTSLPSTPSISSADLSACQGEDTLSVTPGVSGIANHHIYRAVSADGKVFVGETTPVLESASVPEAVLAPDGTIWLYFVNGQSGHHGIFVAQGSAEGSLEIVDCVKLDDEFDPTAVDPDVVRMSDGRYCLFHASFGSPTQSGSGQGGPMIRQAVSDDGIHFTVEGVLVPGTDPSAVQLTDGSWLLAVPRGEKGTDIYRSADGAQFDLLAQVSEARGMPDLVILPDGQVRLYVGGGEFAAFVSNDGGKTWTQESGVSLTVGGKPEGAGGATVIRLPDGTWVLFYIKAGN